METLIVQNSELMVYAKNTNEIVKEMKLDIASIIKLLSKFLSGSIELIYTFNNYIDIKKTKCLVIYKLKHATLNKYRIVIRYGQLKDISKSIGDMLNKQINEDYNIVDYYIIGFVQASLITVQMVYDTLLPIDKNSKQTIKKLTEIQADTIIQNIKNIVEESKFSFYQEEMNKDTNIQKYKDSFNEICKLDNAFNQELSDVLDSGLRPKIFDGNNFPLTNIARRLNEIYTKYKNL